MFKFSEVFNLASSACHVIAQSEHDKLCAHMFVYTEFTYTNDRDSIYMKSLQASFRVKKICTAILYDKFYNIKCFQLCLF